MSSELRQRAFEIHSIVEEMQGELEDGGEHFQARLALARIDGQVIEFLQALEGVQLTEQPKKRGRRGRKPAGAKRDDGNQMELSERLRKSGADGDRAEE